MFHVNCSLVLFMKYYLTLISFTWILLFFWFRPQIFQAHHGHVVELFRAADEAAPETEL